MKLLEHSAFLGFGLLRFGVQGVAWCLGIVPQLHVSGLKALCYLSVASLQLV